MNTLYLFSVLNILKLITIYDNNVGYRLAKSFKNRVSVCPLRMIYLRF